MMCQTLTGQKYGEPLLPVIIPENEFDTIIKVNYITIISIDVVLFLLFFFIVSFVRGGDYQSLCSLAYMIHVIKTVGRHTYVHTYIRTYIHTYIHTYVHTYVILP